MSERYLRNLNAGLLGLILVVLTGALAAFSFLALAAFQQNLVPEVSQKANDVGRSIVSLVTRSQIYGLDLRRLVGVERVFEAVQHDNPEFSYYAVAAIDGEILYHVGTPPAGYKRALRNASGTRELADSYLVRIPITEPASRAESGGDATTGQRVGTLIIGFPKSYISNQVREIFLDLLAVLVVSLFLTYELLFFIAGARLQTEFGSLGAVLESTSHGDLSQRIGRKAVDEVGGVLVRVDAVLDRVNAHYADVVRAVSASTGDAGGRARAALAALQRRFTFGRHALADQARGDAFLGLIRTPLFLFIFAEELSRPFLPLYVKELASNINGISPQVVIGLPIMLFMFVVALSQPVIGAWSERTGRRHVFLVGAALGVVGFGLTAFAHSLWDLLLYRSITAVGYGMVFGAAQGYVLDNSSLLNRSRGLALFIGAIMVAGTCGPSIGGILADRIGFRLTFVVSTALAALAAVVVARLLPKQTALQADVQVGLAEVMRLLKSPRFMGLMLFSSVPAKVILTAFAFYLIPLYTTQLGANPSTAGRFLMLYAILMVFLVPVAARFSDRLGRRPLFVGLGLAISGLGGLLLVKYQDLMVLLVVVLLLGLGQAISIAPQSALVGDLIRREKIDMSESTAYGVFRLIERLGNTLGPLVAGLLLTRLGFSMTFTAIGAYVVASALVFFATMRSMPGMSPVTSGLAPDAGIV